MDMQLVALQSDPSQPITEGHKNMDTPLIPESGNQSPAEDPVSRVSHPNHPTLIAVMGVTGSGKTTFVNQASKAHLKVGEDLGSCTSEIQVSEEFILDGRRVMLIDTPGFDDTHRSDTEILKLIAAFLAESYLAGAKLAGVIYIHKISDDRFGGLAVKNFKMFRELCGEKTLKNVILMTNMWGRVVLQKGIEREQQLREEYFKSAIDKGARMCRHHNTPKSARAILRKVLENQPAPLKIQQELIDEGKDFEHTGAGAELKREIDELVERHQREIIELKESMREAIEGRDEESRQELEGERRRMEGLVEKLQKDSAEMLSKFEEARRGMERRISETVAAQAAQIRREYEADIQRYEDRVRELESEGLENTTEMANLREEFEKLQEKWNRRWGCTIM